MIDPLIAAVSTAPSTPTDRFSASLAATVQVTRRARNLSINALAEASGVSRAMIGKIERGEAQPTAALLGRLSNALKIPLSNLIAQAEANGAPRVVRACDQPTWTDPESGHLRRSISPRPGGLLQLVEVVLPPGAQASYPAETYAFSHHQIWVLAGRLDVEEGQTRQVLHAGDCLELGEPAPCTYRNPTTSPCRYLVALTRRPG